MVAEAMRRDAPIDAPRAISLVVRELKRKTADVPLGAERCFRPICVFCRSSRTQQSQPPNCDWGIPFSGFDEEQFRETLRREVRALSEEHRANVLVQSGDAYDDAVGLRF